MKEQIYVVAPAIEESEFHDIQNIQNIFQFFQKNFPHLRIDFMHGKQTSDEKESIIQNFYKQQIQVLISTSVIEVGIDTPNATVMCIFLALKDLACLVYTNCVDELVEEKNLDSFLWLKILSSAILHLIGLKFLNLVMTVLKSQRLIYRLGEKATS